MKVHDKSSDEYLQGQQVIMELCMDIHTPSCCQVFVIVHVVFIQSYGLGGKHYCMLICDRPHTYYSLRNF